MVMSACRASSTGDAVTHSVRNSNRFLFWVLLLCPGLCHLLYLCDQDETSGFITGKGAFRARTTARSRRKRSGWANSQDCSNNNRTGHPCMIGTGYQVPVQSIRYQAYMIHTDIIHGIELAYQTIGIKLLYYVYPFNTHVPIQQTHT